jgi:hypothetical protein
VLQGDCDTLGTEPGELVGPQTDQLPTTRSELEITHSASPHTVPEPGITQKKIVQTFKFAHDP